MLRCLLAVIALVSCFEAVLTAQSPSLKGTRMLECSGLPCVDLTLASGKHLKMLIDTGDLSSIVDTESAKAAGLDSTPVNGADGKPATGYARSTLSGARLGDASFGDIKILVTDIQQYIKKDHMPAADGSLAYTAFKDRLLELDYIHHTVRVSELLTGDVKCPKFCGTITTLTFGKKGPPIVVSTGFSIHGKQVTAQVDTLFSGSMLIYPGSVQKLGLDQAAKTTAKRFFKYTDDGVDILESLSHEECFGDRVLAKNAAVYFATPAVHLPDDMFDATVGDELFRRSVLTLDFHNMKLWM